MSQFPAGRTVIGRIDNSAVGSVATIAFTDISGNTYTFLAGDRLIIYGVQVNNRATAKDLTIFQDADNDGAIDAGEAVFVFSFAAAGFVSRDSNRGIATLKINDAANNLFKALASATGAVDILIQGEVIKS